MTDERRFQEMATIVRRALDAAGIAPTCVRCDVDGRTLTAGYYPRGGGAPDWEIGVQAPWDFVQRGRLIHHAATLVFGGQVTPLSLQIVTLLDGMMWSDRAT